MRQAAQGDDSDFAAGTGTTTRWQAFDPDAELISDWLQIPAGCKITSGTDGEVDPL
jgi:hypothetical protein